MALRIWAKTHPDTEFASRELWALAPIDPGREGPACLGGAESPGRAPPFRRIRPFGFPFAKSQSLLGLPWQKRGLPLDGGGWVSLSNFSCLFILAESETLFVGRINSELPCLEVLKFEFTSQPANQPNPPQPRHLELAPNQLFWLGCFLGTPKLCKGNPNLVSLSNGPKKSIITQNVRGSENGIPQIGLVFFCCVPPATLFGLQGNQQQNRTPFRGVPPPKKKQQQPDTPPT